MATERFLHMRLTREDCATLDALVAKVNRDRSRGEGDLGFLAPRTQSDIVRLAIVEALKRRVGRV